MKSGKQIMSEGIELPTPAKKIRVLRKKRNLQILGNIGSGHHQTGGNERKKLKRLSQENEKTTGSQTIWQKSHQMKKRRGCPPCQIFLKWTGAKLQQMDQRIRKLMTMHKALHPRDDVDRLYVLKKGGWGLASIEDSADTLIQTLEDYIRKRRGRQITATRNNTDKTNISGTKSNLKKMGRKANVWIFLATNKQNLTRENLDMAMKG